MFPIHLTELDLVLTAALESMLAVTELLNILAAREGGNSSTRSYSRVVSLIEIIGKVIHMRYDKHVHNPRIHWIRHIWQPHKQLSKTQSFEIIGKVIHMGYDKHVHNPGIG